MGTVQVKLPCTGHGSSKWMMTPWQAGSRHGPFHGPDGDRPGKDRLFFSRSGFHARPFKVDDDTLAGRQSPWSLPSPGWGPFRQSRLAPAMEEVRFQRTLRPFSPAGRASIIMPRRGTPDRSKWMMTPRPAGSRPGPFHRPDGDRSGKAALHRPWKRGFLFSATARRCAAERWCMNHWPE
jgi:hypothetical protein